MIEALKNKKNLTIDSELQDIYGKIEERERFVMSIENSNDDSERKENRHISLVKLGYFLFCIMVISFLQKRITFLERKKRKKEKKVGRETNRPLGSSRG
jgi:hypothetical protein